VTAARALFIEELRKVLALGVDQFVGSVSAAEMDEAERWASIAFGLIDALAEPSCA